MKTITLKRNDKFNPKDFVYRTAREQDYHKLICEDVTILDKDTGEIVLVYFVIPKVSKHLLKAIHGIKYDSNKRLKGLMTKSRIFGWRHREETF